MKPKVYIETSIAGYLTARRMRDRVVMANVIETRRWWKSSRDSFELFTSQLVIDEASAGDMRVSSRRVKLLKSLTFLQPGDKAEVIADSLLTTMVLPPKARNDAAHVGIAATNGMDYLLTWNCRHLANAMLRTRIELVCRQHGFEAPIICTPSELNEVLP